MTADREHHAAAGARELVRDLVAARPAADDQDAAPG